MFLHSSSATDCLEIKLVLQMICLYSLSHSNHF